MTRNREEVILYSLAAYFSVSAFATVPLLLASLAVMKLVFLLSCFSLGPEKVYWLKPLIYDSAGFALASGGMAVIQYYLASLLHFSGAGRTSLLGAVFFSSLLCGLFFWRGAAYSSLGAYAFSGLCVTLSALLGGLSAVFQRPGDNPWPFTVSAYFR